MASKIKLSLQEWTEGWSKWNITLFVGAPVALGLAGIWFYTRSQRNIQSTQKKQGENSVKGEDIIDNDSRPQTPLEKAQAAKAKGNKYFKGGKYDQAISCYTEAINLCPPDQEADLSTFYQNRAASLEHLANYDGVIQDCSKAIELNSKYIKAYSRRSKGYQQAGKLKESLEDITTACILEGFTNQINLQLADQILKDLGRKCAKESFVNRKPVPPSKFFVKNYLNGFANDPIKSFKLKHRTHQTDSEEKSNGPATTIVDNSTSENGLQNGFSELSPFEQAVENLQNENIDDIISLCTQEMELADPNHLHLALLLRGTFYLICGQIDLGNADFETLICSPAVDIKIKSNAIIKQSSIFIQKEKVTEAFENFEKAIEADPDNSDVYHHRGQQYLVVDKLELAIDDLEKSIKLNPNFPTSYVQRAYAVHRTGVIYHKESALIEASNKFEEAIQKFPNYSDASLMYAQSLTDQGKFEEGLKYFNKAIELEPDNPNIYVHKGLLLVQWKSQLEEGTKLVEEAVKIDPKCEYAYEILGTIDVQRGKMSQALEYFNKAICLSRSEGEMAHLHSLLNAAQAQVTVAHNLGISIPSMG